MQPCCSNSDIELSPTKISVLSQQIEKDHKNNQLAKCRSMKFLENVDRLMYSNPMGDVLQDFQVSYVKCIPFGSSATKLKTSDSDLDTVIVLEEMEELMPEAKIDLLFAMKGKISAHFKFYEAVVVHKAKVPVIRCKGMDYEADFVLHFGETIPSNYLAVISTNAYCQIEPKLVQLCFMLKKWGKHFMKKNYIQKEIRSGIPNSYTLVLLAICMLQQHNILPNLIEIRPDLFDIDQASWDTVGKVSMMYPLKKIELARIKERLDGSGLSVGDMTVLFFQTYANMDLCTLRIDMRTSTIVEKEQWSPTDGLLVIDPYDHHIPSRRVTAPYIFEKLCQKSIDTIESSEDEKVYNSLMTMWFGPELPNGSPMRRMTWRELGFSCPMAYHDSIDHNTEEKPKKQKIQYSNPKIKPEIVEKINWAEIPWIPTDPPFGEE